MKQVTVEELKAMMDGGEEFTLVDVRDDDEVEVSMIPRATHIQLDQLPQRLDELPKSAKLVMHCKGGGRSSRAVEFLEQQGYTDVANLKGGMQAWVNKFEPGKEVA